MFDKLRDMLVGNNSSGWSEHWISNPTVENELKYGQRGDAGLQRWSPTGKNLGGDIADNFAAEWGAIARYQFPYNLNSTENALAQSSQCARSARPNKISIV